MSEKEAKLVSITMAWDDGSSLAYAPNEWDDVDRLIVAILIKEATQSSDQKNL